MSSASSVQVNKQLSKRLRPEPKTTPHLISSFLIVLSIAPIPSLLATYTSLGREAQGLIPKAKSRPTARPINVLQFFRPSILSIPLILFCLFQEDLWLPLRHDKAIRPVLDFAPRKRLSWPTRKKGMIDRREFHADANGRPAFGQTARHQEFIVAKTAIGALHDVLCGA